MLWLGFIDNYYVFKATVSATWKASDLEMQAPIKPSNLPQTWPRGYKTFFMLKSTEHEISTTH